MTGESFAYLLALSVVSLMAYVTGERAMLRTVGALFGAWVLNWGYVTLSGSYVPWAWFMLVDAAAASVILLRPAGRVQGLIGVCFLIQLALHAGYGLNYVQYGYSYPAQIQHWEWNYLLGFVKLFLVGAWAVAHGKAVYHRLLRGARRAFDPAHRESAG